MIVCPAYAKVNLALEVVGQRRDGYHEVVSILQTVDLCDTLSVVPAPDLSFTCDDPTLGGEANLVWRAASALRERTACRQGAALRLAKRIPVAAGLGGGSSDAAAALLALNRLWGLGLPLTQLEGIAATLGSDVPFFLRGGTALVSGRGEVVLPLPTAPERWLVLLCPPLTLPAKTATLYGRLSPAAFDTGERTLAAAASLRRGEFPAEDLLVNTFAKVADDAFASLAQARGRLESVSPGPVHLSGAGPSLFAIFPAHAAAAATARALGANTFSVRTGAWGPTLRESSSPA